MTCSEEGDLSHRIGTIHNSITERSMVEPVYGDHHGDPMKEVVGCLVTSSGEGGLSQFWAQMPEHKGMKGL